ncbi:MAG: hypothetical protein WEB89_05475 [Balneolales bacterium]
MNTKTKALLVFGTLFAVGFASGFLFNNSISPTVSGYTSERAEQADNRERGQRDESRERGEHHAEKIRNWFSDRLDLSNEQQDPFFEHMSEYRSRIRSELKEMKGRESEFVRQHYNAMRNELSNVLNPEQLKKLDSHVHPDSVMHRRRSNRSGRPDRRD